jgi:hypothetical protein
VQGRTLRESSAPGEEVTQVVHLYTCLTHTAKHVMGGVDSAQGARQVIEPAARRARPIVSAIACWMVSQLHLDTPVTEILLTWCG